MEKMQEFYSWILKRDLDRLINEVNSFKEESTLWKTPGDVTNSAGNLVLHIAGNLNHFIGSILGKNGYVRERDREFNDKNVPADQLIHSIKNTRDMISDILPGLNDEALAQEMPVKLSDGKTYNGAEFIVHLSGHLNYHLGQINYLRRILEG